MSDRQPVQQGTGWRPLRLRVERGKEIAADDESEVPMSGKPALFFVPKLGVVAGSFDHIGTWDWVVIPPDGGEEKCLQNLTPPGDEECLTPTHWMPLPEPPNA